jgi:uncharacterized protein (DUF736 family)
VARRGLLVSAIVAFAAFVALLFAVFHWVFPPQPRPINAPVPEVLHGIVEQAGAASVAEVDGGTRQYLSVRLDDGRVVQAVTARDQPLLEKGMRVDLRSFEFSP